MQKLLHYYRVSALGIALVMLAGIFFIMVNKSSAAAVAGKVNDQTNSNSRYKKKTKKVVKPKMTVPTRTTVSSGTWGGNGIAIVVEPKSARIEYDCAHGEITETLTIDKNGYFDAKGIHVREMGGPIRQDSPNQGQPARYTGRVVANGMTLKVTLTDSGTVVGDYDLDHGRNPRLHKCM